ncbi:MAG: transketolase [Prevotellaceae bacterium]|jgi:transketolase|nr:transketolase [Prevotellaceae bacterium]
MEINRIKIRTWSMLGERRTFGAGIYELAAELDNLFIMTGDTKSSSGLDRYAAAYPDKYLSAGIAEQNMVCMASGLASEGKVVFITSFSPFITGRCYDQIRIHLGYMQHNVKLVGLAAGIGLGVQGNSHYGLEDVSLMRAIPGMTIVSPADCTEVVKAIQACYLHDGPVYLRLTGEQNVPVLYKEDYDFQIGKAITMREGNDVTIIAAGTMVAQSLRAADLLANQGIEASVINMHTIKPLDKESVDKACEQSQLIVTVEEGTVVGGLGAAVSEYKTAKRNAPEQLILGINDFFPHPGTYPYMLEQCGLSSDKIVSSIIDKLNSL